MTLSRSAPGDADGQLHLLNQRVGLSESTSATSVGMAMVAEALLADDLGVERWAAVVTTAGRPRPRTNWLDGTRCSVSTETDSSTPRTCRFSTYQHMPVLCWPIISRFPDSCSQRMAGQ